MLLCRRERGKIKMKAQSAKKRGTKKSAPQKVPVHIVRAIGVWPRDILFAHIHSTIALTFVAFAAISVMGMAAQAYP